MRKKAYLCRMDFARILTERYALSDEGTGLLMHSATLTRHARKEVIIEEGQRDADVCFVAEGSVRTYVMREDKCVIFSFSFEGDPCPRPRARSVRSVSVRNPCGKGTLFSAIAKRPPIPSLPEGFFAGLSCRNSRMCDNL